MLPRPCESAERLIGQGENVTGLIYGLASRLRARLRGGRPAGGGPTADAGRVLAENAPLRRASNWSRRLRDADVERAARATEALADLELWCRGGADYGDELALTLALRRAAGVAA